MHYIDVIIIIVYVAAMIAVGIACRGKQDVVEDYFTARGGLAGKFGSILVGFSIAATLFSGISFMAYPSIMYTQGPAVFVLLLGLLGTWPFVTLWFLPRYLTEENRHPYDIIERRFGLGVRLVAASMFVLLRIGWMAALIFAPTLALQAASGLEGPFWFWFLVILIGLSSTIYTTFGGIRGVIVTDALQFVTIAVGVLLTVWIAIDKIPVSVTEAFGALREQGVIRAPSMSFDPTNAYTLWALTIGAGLAQLSSYVGDQMSLQRYMSSGTAKEASRAFMYNIIGAVGVVFLLGAVGMTIRAYYIFLPDASMPEGADKVFPHFISTQLPPGIAGILLAAILAATMSSMTSGINALAGTLTLDFRMRLWGEISHRDQLRFGRICSFVIGVLATAAAGFVSALGNIFEMSQALLGVFLGPLLTCIVLAIAKKPLQRPSLIVGLLLSCALGWVVIFTNLAGQTWIAAIVFVLSMIITLTGTAIFGPSVDPKNAPAGTPEP